MKSPFPGMDPYLEDPAFWRDFHSTFIPCWREQIADLLPGHYEVRIGENLYLCEEIVETESTREPDMMVLRSRRKKTNDPTSGGNTATLDPVTLPLIILAEFRQTFIKLIHRPSRKVVAVLELLSPANKNEPGKSEYLKKRNELICQNVHIIELDLLLNGQRIPLGEPLPAADYFYLVCRSNKRFDCDVYSWNMNDKLPTVPVPLQSPDSDILCDLAKVFALTYERGRYRKDVDYDKPPLVKFSATQKKWVGRQVRGL